ncbi:hypothetical protein [Bradyrhizobium sp.]|jgi:hypothetical protein|uniref:hypothetical protein n=1 Tax=Bradyrhizobium sp. TaxID=376 RepID=UPI003C7367F5
MGKKIGELTVATQGWGKAESICPQRAFPVLKRTSQRCDPLRHHYWTHHSLRGKLGRKSNSI